MISIAIKVNILSQLNIVCNSKVSFDVTVLMFCYNKKFGHFAMIHLKIKFLATFLPHVVKGFNLVKLNYFIADAYDQQDVLF